jgi:hypothetical protein
MIAVDRTRFLPSEAVARARAIEPLLREEGRRRQQMAGGSSPQKSTAAPHRTRTIIEQHCGMSWRTLQKAIAVVRAAEDDPDRFGTIARNMDISNNIERAFCMLAAERLVGQRTRSIFLGA